MLHKNLKNVEKVVFGRGCFMQLGNIIAPYRNEAGKYFVFVIDQYFAEKELLPQLPAQEKDVVLYINVDVEEPTTQLIDRLRDELLQTHGKPSGLVGIGGGSIMDIAKALSLMLTNDGPSELYQGLNLIKQPGIYHVGVPTISGTGAEVSSTAVLTGPVKKLGLKCEWTVFDQILLDPTLTATVPRDKWFYTGMDTYIHCIESKNGILNNAFSHAYAEQALVLCEEVYLGPHGGQNDENDEKLMVASMMGGLSLTYSEVGICHALSYGLSKILGYKHCYANCIAFQHLGDYYAEGVEKFKKMLIKNDITLPQNLAGNWTQQQVSDMAEVAYKLTHMWRHALGENWETLITQNDIVKLYNRL